MNITKTISEDKVAATLDLACEALTQYQAPDGHFAGDTHQGTAPTAQTLIVERFLGVLDPAEAAAAVDWLSSHIRPDGSVAAYPGASFPSLLESGCVYAALAAAGLPPEDPRRRRVRAFIKSRGDLPALDPLTQLYLVLADVLPASSLPETRLEHVLVPGIERYVGRTFNAYFGTALAFIFPGLLWGLRNKARAGNPGPLERVMQRRIIDYLLTRQNPEGNWLGTQWSTTLALACLHALGLPPTHDAIARGLESLGRLKRRTASGLWVMPFNATVWNTAMALRVLTRARPATSAGSTGRAVEYLLSKQSVVVGPPEWTNMPAGAPRCGGWSFEAGNVILPDTDTTAMVLVALAQHAKTPRVSTAIHRGEQWLLSLQNGDGGFAAFTRDQRTAPPQAMFGRMPDMPRGPLQSLRFFLRPPFEFVDMPSADLTGRVLTALGRLGYQRGAAPVARAVQFIYSQRLGDVWWGRWTTNYLAATAFVIQGLWSTGEPLQSDWVRRAIDWTLAHQNRDGGFGECNESYANPGLAGTGPSNAYLTGLVLHALCLAEEGTSPAAARAAAFLCQSQRQDGLWEEFQPVQLIAAEMFYNNFVNFQTAAIEGLAVYREVQDGVSLQESRQHGTPAAAAAQR